MGFSDAVIEAKQVYKQKYWGLISGDCISSDIVAAPLLSFAVNDSVLIACKHLQRVLGVLEDGHIGLKTLEELNEKDPEIVAKLFRAEWISFYQQLVKIAPSKQDFLRGWINRANFPFPTSIPEIYN
jgi:lysozyme family protein